jgi:gamma-aminobutyric acid type B receptor
MRHHNYTDIVDKYRYKNISFIGVDGSADNLNYMATNYVDGLVGEQTYEIGSMAAQSLYKILTEGPESVPDKLPTKLINYNLVPDELPPLEFNQSLLGNLKYVGFTCFGLVAAGVLICTVWTLWHSKSIVVKASQPFFLVMTAGGVLVMGSTLIPLSFDDGGESISEAYAKGICMTIPWLGFLGFSITFSAMFSKTWRVNQFFKSSNAHGRIQVRERDVLLPFFFIFTLNTIILICWTIIDPLVYTRRFADGTDLWNREIASSGSCRSENGALAYLAPLGVSKYQSILNLLHLLS